jgi:1-acyl-sn-glycerol-3-phosphate acyltransferase
MADFFTSFTGQAIAKRRMRNAGDGLPMWPLSAGAAAVRYVVQAPLFAALRLVTRPRVYGLEALEGLAPPVLFVANHASHIDTPLVLSSLPAEWREQVAVAAAADYFFTRKALAAWVALTMNAFPFSRTRGVRRTLEHCDLLCAQGWSLLVFPEGTRSPTGELSPFKPGVGMLALRLGVPVVPVYLGGTCRVLPKGSSVPRPAGVVVRFGRQLDLNVCVSYEAAASNIEKAVRTLAQTTTLDV